MSSGTDWLDAACALQKRFGGLVLPSRRQTMANACLQHSSTFARLACFLASNPHDNDTDYDVLEDEFIEAMQGFQETYQKTLRGKARDDSEVMVMEERDEVIVMEEPITPSPLPLRSPESSPCPASLDDDEYTWETDDVQSVGSQRSDKQWDPWQDFLAGAQTTLLEELQDPLFEQLKQPLTDSLVTPLLEELASPMEERLVGLLPARLATSPQLLATLSVSLTQHAPFIDAIADRLHARKTSAGSPGSAPTSAGIHPVHSSRSTVSMLRFDSVALRTTAPVPIKRESSTEHRGPMKKARTAAQGSILGRPR